MTSPQLSNANTSSEWFRTVGEPGTADKPRSPSQAALEPRASDARRERFVRLVTYTMVGLVAFTLLGVVSFAWRQHAMQSALAAPVPAAVKAPEVSPTAEPAPAAEVAPVANVTATAVLTPAKTKAKAHSKMPTRLRK